MDNERLLVGWKEIMAAFGVHSLKTMKKKVKKYAIPVVTVARKPTVYLHEVKEWRESRRRQAEGHLPPVRTVPIRK